MGRTITVKKSDFQKFQIAINNYNKVISNAGTLANLDTYSSIKWE
ncbi:hypothetical protein ACT7DL_16195 [Bacillus paranthracis]